ncbi:hypothetical protein pEaSNUABM8_00195 [Erwinia phage pEa_SNUABM_8]|nr:hypothetical protein pEaSNUABM8_00195 [Erwinia phage pEa_SNUABM_8]QVW54947.1 hypothetical protein pEaSNUABM4_00194 [Erwinia phage pEa_SNUABM_4]
MPDILFQYPLDLTGKMTSNAVSIPIVLGGGKVNRAFAFPAGPFYADDFKLRPANAPNTTYKRGVDYELIFAHPVYQKLAGNKEVCMAVVVTNSAIPTDVIASTQVVGGPQSAVIAAIKQAIIDANLDDRVVDFKDLRNVPDTFAAAPSFKDIGDIFGFEYIITELAGIKDSINAGNTVQLEQLKSLIENMQTQFMAALNNHINAQGNVHSLDIHQANGLTETEIRALIQGVQTAINAVLADIGDLKAADTAINQRIDAIVAALGSWNDQLNAVAQNYQRMALQMANLNDLVAQLQKMVTDQNQVIAGLNQRVTDLENSGQDTQQQIQQLQQDLTALKQQVANNTSGISTVSQNLTNHINADNPHPKYLHKQYGGVVQAAVHVNSSLTSRDDVQAEAGTK